MQHETFFLKNYAQNVMEKLVPNPFLKNQNWAYLWINSLKFTQFIFISCQVEGWLKILKISCRPFDFTSYKAFLKNKRRSGTILSTSFSAWPFKDKISLSGCLYFMRYWAICLFEFFVDHVVTLWILKLTQSF